MIRIAKWVVVGFAALLAFDIVIVLAFWIGGEILRRLDRASRRLRS